MKYKIVFYISTLILLSVSTINVILTNYNYFQEHTGTILSIPMWRNTGDVYPTGVALFVASVIGLILLPLSLKEKRVRFTLLVLIIFIIIPPILT